VQSPRFCTAIYCRSMYDLSFWRKTMIESGRLSKPGLKRRKKLLSKPTYKKCRNNITVQVKGAKTIQNL